MSMGLSVERQWKTLENCSTKIERWNAPQAARPLQGASGARGGDRASVGAFLGGVGGMRARKHHQLKPAHSHGGLVARLVGAPGAVSDIHLTLRTSFSVVVMVDVDARMISLVHDKTQRRDVEVDI